MDTVATKSDGANYVVRLGHFLGLVYFAQGIGQAGGLLNQPLNNYLQKGLGLGEQEATTYLAVLTIPWTIKPLYGFISDFFPLLGYRRRTWLTVANGLAVAAFIWLTGLTEVKDIVFAVLLSAFGTAASDVIVDAIMVENGDKYKATDRFQSLQWAWLNVALVTTTALGGIMCQYMAPGTALHVAALVAFFAPLSVIFGAWIVVKEEPAEINTRALIGRTKDLWSGFRSKTLWAVSFFLAFWYFNPSMGTIWYQHQSKNLGFSESLIGYIGCAGALGSVLGSVLFGWYFKNKSLKFQIYFSVITGAVATLSYLLLISLNPYTAVLHAFLSFLVGIVSVIATLTTLGLAARACPKETAGVTFALLMSITNTSVMFSSMVGGYLFEDVFNKQLAPLIWVSALFTLACLPLLPLLRGVPSHAAQEN